MNNNARREVVIIVTSKHLADMAREWLLGEGITFAEFGGDGLPTRFVCQLLTPDDKTTIDEVASAYAD